MDILEQLKRDAMERFNVSSSLRYFQPDAQFVQWLVDYANGRLIIECGCGSGDLLIELKEKGANVLGIDPYVDAVPFIQKCFDRGVGMINVIPEFAEDSTMLQLDNVLVLFCRPCHSDWVENTLDTMNPNNEALYIGLAKNVEKDIPNFQYQVLEHKGASKENEIVLSINYHEAG